MKGCFRLLASILAYGGTKSPQDKAAQILLVIGFCVEFVVVYSALVEQAIKDFGVDSVLLWPTKIFVFILLVFAFFHQLQIFRNFSLLSDSDSDSNTKVANIKRYVELSIYIFFGVLTGEAGYMLTIISLPDCNGIIFSFFSNLLGIDNLGLMLKFLFIFVAAVVCLLVIIWDFLFYLQFKDTNIKDINILKKFIGLDILSLFYWGLFALVLIPNAWEWIGVTQDVCNNVTQDVCNNVDRGYVILAWVFMSLFALTYCLVCIKRIKEGIIELAKAPSYEKSLETII